MMCLQLAVSCKDCYFHVLLSKLRCQTASNTFTVLPFCNFEVRIRSFRHSHSTLFVYEIFNNPVFHLVNTFSTHPYSSCLVSPASSCAQTPKTKSIRKLHTGRLIPILSKAAHRSSVAHVSTPYTTISPPLSRKTTLFCRKPDRFF